MPNDNLFASCSTGALLQLPPKVGEYLTMRGRALDYECLKLNLGRPKGHRVIDCVELFRGTIDGANVVSTGSRQGGTR